MNKLSIIDLLSGYMRHDTLYTFSALVNLCKDNNLDYKHLRSDLNKECKKIFKFIEKYNESKSYGAKHNIYYRLVPGVNLTLLREEANKRSTIGMAQAILKLVQEENKKTINTWIDTKFEEKLNECAQNFVKSEFQNEILPVLKQHIDNKIEGIKLITKGQVKECIKEILDDIMRKLKGEE
jgi:hypothetical protein